MKEGAIGCSIFTVIVGLIVLSVAGSVGWWVLSSFVFADEIGRGNAERQIESAPSRISRYEYFFDLCVSVQTAETAIDQETARLEAETNESVRSQIRQNISAQHTVRMNGVNTYNADAKKDYTSARFLASNLPYQLSTQPYVAGGTKTQCAT
jgi:hypothetical protein